MLSPRHLAIVAVAVVLPIFVACGARVEGEEAGAVNSGTQASASESASPAPSATPAPSDAGSSAFPCLSSTAAYYTDPGPPPATGGCPDLYSPGTRHAPGCVRTIVAPTSPAAGSCAYLECVCGATGRWEPAGRPGCDR